MSTGFDVDDIRLNFDPASPHRRFKAAGLEAAFASADALLPTFFAFDDATDHDKLQGLGQVCDMGDAMVAQALQAFPNIAWHSIRNASDPQIANPNNDIEAANKEAGTIYSRYGGLTTAPSVIATWAILQTL